MIIALFILAVIAVSVAGGYVIGMLSTFAAIREEFMEGR